MKIVILDGYTSNPGDLNWDKLKILGDLTVYEYTKNQTEDVVERLQDCEIALTNKQSLRRRSWKLVRSFVISVCLRPATMS